MTILIVQSDFCENVRVIKLIYNNQFSEVFGNVKAIIATAEYAVANSECQVVLSESKLVEKTDSI